MRCDFPPSQVAARHQAAFLHAVVSAAGSNCFVGLDLYPDIERVEVRSDRIRAYDRRHNRIPMAGTD
jgi:hypothetical protein